MTSGSDPTGDSVIQAFSPTTVNALAQCGYRVALERRDPTLRRPSTFSELGIIVHTLNERAWDGAFDAVRPDDLRAAFSAAWATLTAEAAERLAAAYAPASPPAPERWPGAALTRARTLRRLVRLVSDRQSRRPSETTNWVAAEEDIADPASGLGGRLDRLERHGGVLRVVDIKSGLRQAEITDEQRRQLLLYAVLVHARLGEWPSEVVVESAGGQETVINVDPDQALAELANAQALVRRYNEAVTAGGLAVQGLAAPSSESCMYCAARIQCEPYWAAVESGWAYHGSVRGRVAGVASSDAGTSAWVRVQEPHDIADSTIELFGQFLNADPGAAIRVVGATPVANRQKLRVEWNTQVRVDRRSLAGIAHRSDLDDG